MVLEPSAAIRENLLHNARRDPKIQVLSGQTFPPTPYDFRDAAGLSAQIEKFQKDPFVMVRERSLREVFADFTDNRIDYFTLIPTEQDQSDLDRITESIATRGDVLLALYENQQGKQWRGRYGQDWHQANKNLSLYEKAAFLSQAAMQAKQITVVRNGASYDPDLDIIKPLDDTISTSEKRSPQPPLSYKVAINPSGPDKQNPSCLTQAIATFLQDQDALFVKFEVNTVKGRMPKQFTRNDLVAAALPGRDLGKIVTLWTHIFQANVESVEFFYRPLDSSLQQELFNPSKNLKDQGA